MRLLNIKIYRSIEYKNKELYKDGEEVDSKKVKGFARRVQKALNTISQTEKGAELINTLSESTFTFIIKRGLKSSFKSDNVVGAFLLARKELTPQFFDNLMPGSGGVINWNTAGKVLATTQGGTTNPTIDLAHELFHGYDANFGKMDDRLEKGIKRNEWQAVYNENLLREQMGLPLRTHYITGTDDDGRFIMGAGPSMFEDGIIIRPWWY